MKRSLVLLAVGLAGLAAVGCAKSLNAPDVKNACYHVAPQKNGSINFYKVADNDKSMYYCAAQLDEIRFRFLGLGGNRDSIVGLYNGAYIFIDSNGMATSTAYDGPRYTAGPRGVDGRLALPGNVPQPGPSGAGIMITQNPMDEQNVKGSRSAKK